jgi:phosphoglycerol transferase MdoB-like AlkP superfamily enzyme
VGGLIIRQPSFNRGGVVTRNIDKFANGGVVTPNIDNFLGGMRR